MASLRAVASEAKAAFATRPRELAALFALAALTIGSYGFARPAAESLFLERYGSARLPWAWLGVGIGAIAVTAAYNRVIASVALVRLWPRAVGVAVLTLTLILGAASLEIEHAEFFLYIWKDLYIVVLVELFWSIANVSFPLARARWLYGAFLAAGSLGGFAAEISVGALAAEVGSLAAVGAAIPLLALTVLLTPLLPEAATARGASAAVRVADLVRRGAAVLRESRYLLLLVGMVALVQISITVIDYQYNVALEAYAPDVDERTGLSGKLYAIISLASIALQLGAGLIIRGLGIPVVIAAAPMLLLAGSLAFAVSPRFGLVAAVKIISKAMDYSLGRAAKELLYIPLSYAEKTEGKAIVDLLSYRLAKAFASTLLLWLIAAELGAGSITALVVGMLVGWLVLAVVIGRRFRHLRHGDE